ncbi:MAG: NTP/NDP exchange transporter [Simkaniaceae bacterium]|nr:NTP/NDP exchange transporter [Simkaniaceae bacterium]
MSESSTKAFGKWRDKFWPFHSYELKKMLPLILMKFLVSLNYGLLTCLKDTVVVTSKSGGAEVIPVLKGWVVLPISILMTLIYSKVSNMVKRTTLFYLFIVGFLVTIFMLGFILYPNLDLFSPHESADALTAHFGGKFTHSIALYRNWIQSIIFITAELWGTMVILLMFWGFANHITTLKEAKKSYTIYIAAGDFAALLVGPLIYMLSKVFAGRDFAVTVQAVTTIVLIVGAFIIGIYWWTNRYVLTDARFFTPKAEEPETPKLKKKKPSLRESLLHIAKSKYLFHIAVLVISYGLTISIVEVTWKAHLNLYYPNPSDYNSLMALIFSLVGFTSFMLSFFVCGSIIRWFGWHFTAQLSPYVLGVTGVIFFLTVIFKDSLAPLFAHMGMSPLFFIVILGAFHNVTSKVMKYSFFDPTKEMAYIPLSDDEKVKGKASIDVVGSRLGKSGSSWIQVGLLDLFGMSSVLGITSYLLPVVVVTVFIWSYSAKRLNFYFHQKNGEQHVLEESSVS